MLRTTTLLRRRTASPAFYRQVSSAHGPDSASMANAFTLSSSRPCRSAGMEESTLASCAIVDHLESIRTAAVIVTLASLLQGSSVRQSDIWRATAAIPQLALCAAPATHAAQRSTAAMWPRLAMARQFGARATTARRPAPLVAQAQTVIEAAASPTLTLNALGRRLRATRSPAPAHISIRATPAAPHGRARYPMANALDTLTRSQSQAATDRSRLSTRRIP